jgi:formylglycine-generating enzyme required for sulfatase activity
MRNRTLSLWLPLAAAVLLLAPAASAVVTIDWVPIGNPGNAADTPSTNCFASSCGSVSYAYQISKYEVSNAEYAEFLNAKAASDPLELYNTSMNSDATNGGITQSGVSGSFSYAVKSGFASKPVNYVSFYDTLRFSNWLNNGQGSGDTETGAYTLLGGTVAPSNGTTVVRNGGATVFLPSENEWYKAAYYNAVSTSYFDYPAGTNTTTVCAAPTATANRANCRSAGVTTVGAYTGSASPYGTYDQGGNVYERNEQILSVTARGIRGGSWRSVEGDLAASFPFSGSPTSQLDYFGFRVASLVGAPPPVPIGDVVGLVVAALLVMTGLLGLAYRQRRHGRAT